MQVSGRLVKFERGAFLLLLWLLLLGGRGGRLLLPVWDWEWDSLAQWAQRRCQVYCPRRQNLKPNVLVAFVIR